MLLSGLNQTTIDIKITHPNGIHMIDHLDEVLNPQGYRGEYSHVRLCLEPR
jgi:hypothetical protein